MARKKLEQLRDAVVRAAIEWDAAAPTTGAVIPSQEDWIAWMDRADALATAVAEHQAYLEPIVDTPGHYVEGSPETSQMAAQAYFPMSGSVRRKIVDEIFSVQHWNGVGLTDAELEHRLKGKHETVSAARCFLVEIGWLVDSGQRRVRKETKQPAVIWRLSDIALTKMKGAGHAKA